MTRRGSTEAGGHGNEGVLAGSRLPKSMTAPTAGFDPTGMDEVSVHLMRLKALHPGLTVRFRTEELAAMTDEERRLLLLDCYEVLGIVARDRT